MWKNRTDGAEQKLHGQMDRWTEGEDAQGSKITPGGWLGMSAADTGGQVLK